MDVTEKIYRTIVRLARQRGFSFASQERIGEYVGRTDRTVRRHLRILEAEGAIRVERPNRNSENLIFVVADRVRSDFRSDIRSSTPLRVRSHKETRLPTRDATTRTLPRQALNATKTPPSAAVADGLLLIEKIVEKGVSVRVAHQLVIEHDAAAIKAQLVALEWRKPRDPAATLVTAIREGWSPPVTLLDVLNRKRKDDERTAAERAQRDRDDSAAARLEKTRLEALKRLDSMPADERDRLEARARAEVHERTARFVATDSIVFEKMVLAKMTAAVADSALAPNEVACYRDSTVAAS